MFHSLHSFPGKRRRRRCIRGVFFVLIVLSRIVPAAENTPSPESPRRTPTATEHAEESKILLYHSGLAFGDWIDFVGQQSGNAFLPRLALGPLTWMRLLSACGILAIAGLLSSLLTWSIVRKTGRLESDAHQSWFHIALSALRKPLALIGWLTGGYFAAALLIGRIEPLSTRFALFNLCTSLAYAGRILIFLWIVFRLVLGMEKRLRQWAETRGGFLESVLLPLIGYALRIVVPLLALILLLPLMDLPPDLSWVATKITVMFIIGGVSYLLIRAANLTEKALLRAHRIDTADNLEARKIYTSVSVIKKIVVVTISILGVGSILMLFQPLRQIGSSILASAGIAGIVLGIAAQRTLGNLLAGIQIALTQPIRIDDVVIVEGEWGKIEEINLTYVVIRIWDLRRLVVPITYFVEKPFQNWTRASSTLLGTIFLYMDYRIDVDAIRVELRRLCEENRQNGLWDGDVCGLQVTDSKDQVIELRCLASSPDAPKSFDLRCVIREKLIAFIQQNYPESLPRARAELSPLALLKTSALPLSPNSPKRKILPPKNTKTARKAR